MTDGTILVNRNGVTTSREVSDAVTAEKKIIFVNQNVDIPSLNVAGHEAFHFWKDSAGRDAYIQTVEENLRRVRKKKPPVSKLDTGGFRGYAENVQEVTAASQSRPQGILRAIIKTPYWHIEGNIRENVPISRPAKAAKPKHARHWRSSRRDCTRSLIHCFKAHSPFRKTLISI